MRGPPCALSWQVEAARDGRLDADTGRMFAQHLRGCRSCRAEQAALDDLARGLADLGQQAGDEIALRRLRQQTLEKANQLLVHGAPKQRSLRAWSGFAAACAALTLTLTLTNALVSRHGEPPVEAARPSAVRVEAAPDARWQRTLTKHVEHVQLSSGSLLFRVQRTASDPRLLVHVPDGEIEDLGTTFRVSVQAGKTREIIVNEGRVLFHRRGSETVHLVAGSTWMPPPDSAPAATAAHVDTEPTPEAAPPTPAAAPKAAAASLARRRARADGASTQAAEAAERAREDAAYLHVLALLRDGRRAEARLAAFEYLRAFPRGFRHTEVLRVAGSLGPSADGGSGSP